jgi:hypothetical protein
VLHARYGGGEVTTWMCPRCGKRPVTELGATSCEECAKPVETQDDRHVGAIVLAKTLLKQSIEGPPDKQIALALQGILTVQIELLESQPDPYDFIMPEQPPEPPLGPRPWG